MMIHVDTKFWFCDKQTCPLWVFIHCKSDIFAEIHLKAGCISGLEFGHNWRYSAIVIKLLCTACIWWFAAFPWCWYLSCLNMSCIRNCRVSKCAVCSVKFHVIFVLHSSGCMSRKGNPFLLSVCPLIPLISNLQ